MPLPWQEQIARLEPLLLVGLALHGLLIAAYVGAAVWQFAVLGAVGGLGLVSWYRPSVSDGIRFVRAVALIGMAWVLMGSTGGTDSVFLPWWFVIAAVYPLLFARTAYAWTVAGVVTGVFLLLLPFSPETAPSFAAIQAVLLLFMGGMACAVGLGIRRGAAVLKHEHESRDSEAYRRKLYHITSAPNLSDEAKIQRLLALGCERLGVENGLVSHIDEAAGRYEVQVAYGSDYIQAGTETRLSTMYCERTIRSDDILGIYDAAEEGWNEHPSYEMLHIGCYIGGKILIDDDLYGTLCFVNRAPREEPFTHDEKAFVDLMTRWMSHAFERRKHTQHLRIKHRAMETAPVGITLTKPKQDGYPIVYVNEKFQQLTGYTADECLGRTHRFLQGEETDADQVAKLRAAIDAKQPATIELLNYRKDGTAFWNRMSIAPVVNEAGAVTYFVGFQEDVTERKEAERQLRERERQLARYKQYTDDILNAIEDLLFVADETGALLRWNETLPAVTGYSDEEIASMHALEIFAEDDRDAVRSAIDRVMQTGHGRVEARLIAEEGTSLPYEFAACALEDPDGNRVLAGIGRDISERKEREQQLHAREQELERTTALLQRIQRMAQVGGFELDMRTDPPTSRWTDELYRLHDLPHDADIDLDTIVDCYHPDDRDRVRQVIESSLASGTGYDIEARMIIGANDLRWVRAISDAVYEDGEFVAFRGAIQDITERKHAEEALRASEARFRTLVENTPVIFFATDRDGIFTVSEGRQLTRLSREPGELVGQSIFDVYADYPAIPENMHRVLAGEERTWRAEIEDLILDAYGAPLRNENGEVVGAIGVATDVTERTRVARENARLVDDLRTMSIRLLEAQEQERRRIARELHDEAGALLTSLQMCLDTARQHIPADGAPVAHEELQEAQDLTSTLSAQIRQMALNLRPSVLDDLGLAAALQWLADQHAKRAGLTVRLYHELGERQRFSETVETAAYRIIQEALTNASRYADVEEVQVMVNVLEDRLRIHVIDEGRGFDLERVQKEHATVGLASMRERAELLQGELEIATAPGEGTRISATLPIQTPAGSPQ